MMMKRFFLLVVAAFSMSFQYNQKSRIIGRDLTIPAQKVYICDANFWEEILDSAEVKNGNFVFELSDGIVPSLASVFYLVEEAGIQAGF